MYVFPESELVVVHRVNTYLMMGERNENISNLIDMVLAAKTEKASKKPKLAPFMPEQVSEDAIDIPKDILNQYLGTYTHPFFKEIEVYLEDEQLKVKGKILGNFRLIPKSNTEFKVEDIPELPLEMIKTEDEGLKGTSTTEVNERRIPVKIIIYC